MYKVTYDDKRYALATNKALVSFLKTDVLFKFIKDWISFSFNYENVQKENVEKLLKEIRTCPVPYTLYIEDSYINFNIKIEDLSYFGNKLALKGYIYNLEAYLNE